MEAKTKHAHGMTHMEGHSKKHNEPLSAPGAEHKRLQVFVGKWKTEGKTVAGPDAPSERIIATDTYEWLEGGFFLIHLVEGQVGDNKVRVLEVIEYDQEDEGFIAHSFDNTGNHNHMHLTFSDGAWLLTGESERSTLVVSNDGNTMTAKWERTTDGKNWRPWMVVTLTKQV